MTDPTPLRTREQDREHLADLDHLERSLQHRAPPRAREDDAPAPPRTGSAVRPPPPKAPALPEPSHGHLEELGRMSAEAVMTQWDATAKEVEDLGIAVKDRVKKIAESLIELDGNLKELAETAASVREKGNHAKMQIEEASLLSKALREACEDIRKKTRL